MCTPIFKILNPSMGMRIDSLLVNQNMIMSHCSNKWTCLGILKYKKIICNAVLMNYSSNCLMSILLQVFFEHGKT